MSGPSRVCGVVLLNPVRLRRRRDQAGCSIAVPEQRGPAGMRTWPLCRDHRVALANLHVAVEHHEEFFGGLTLVRENRPGLELNNRREVRDATSSIPGQSRE